MRGQFTAMVITAILPSRSKAIECGTVLKKSARRAKAQSGVGYWLVAFSLIEDKSWGI